MLAVVIAEGVAIALLAVLVLGLLRSHALILRALHELGAGLDLDRQVGADAPAGPPGPVPIEVQTGVMAPSRAGGAAGHDVVGTSLADEQVHIPVSGAGRRTLLAFLSSGCSVCETFWSQMARGDLQVPGDARLVVVTKDLDEESESRLRQLAGDRLEVVLSSAAWGDYGVPGSPYFVNVDDGSVTGEGSATSWAQVSDLMAQSIADTAANRRRKGLPARGADASADGGRDDLGRIDRDLLGAGLYPGHESLYQAPDAGQENSHDHVHDHVHDHAHDREPSSS